ncbi:protein phosphatase 1 regulatory subunit 42 [Pseudoscourfieldia marina]
MDARANEDAIYAALTTTVNVKVVASGTGMVASGGNMAASGGNTAASGTGNTVASGGNMVASLNDMRSDNHVVGGELEQVQGDELEDLEEEDAVLLSSSSSSEYEELPMEEEEDGDDTYEELRMMQRRALTVDTLLRAAAKNSSAPRTSAEDEQAFLARVTHLPLQERGLQDLHPHLSKICPQMRVLYLYDNIIESIGTSLAFAKHITHLYLQGNDIHALGNALSACVKLQKLYLDRNKLAVVSGLENCACLEELSVEHQRREGMPEQRTLAFEPRAMEGVGGSLRILKCTGSNVVDVQPLAALRSLEELSLASNHVADHEELAMAVSNMPRLRTLDATGNPCCRSPSALRVYRNAIVAASGPSLGTLNGKRVLPNERMFAQRRAQNSHQLKR